MSANSFSFDIDPRRENYVRLVGDMHMALEEAMEDEKLNKTDIAGRLGIHKSVVTRRLAGTSNMTFESLADLAWALNRRVAISLIPLNHLKAGSNCAPPSSAPARPAPRVDQPAKTASATTSAFRRVVQAPQRVGGWQ